ncbi:MAG: cell division protein [Proteobacteria bacterium]|nr:cell division protein [Pseudomonadota bacterium]
MFARDPDVPLRRDTTSRFLPWLIGLMVYLAALLVAGAIALDGAADRWDRAITGTVTVQVPAASEAAEAGRRVEALLDLLRQTPGVAAATAVPPEGLAKLLEPWLGPGAASAGLPLPGLIDVRVEERSRIDFAALSAKLAEAVPGTAVDTHELWAGRIVALARSLQALAALIVGLVAGAAVAAVVLSARAGLSVHREAIELLHLIGAEDSYIAGQFGRQALDLALVGGFLGLFGALATLLFLSWMARGIGGSLLPELTLTAWQWAGLLALPLVAGAVAAVSAWLTVVRTLGRMT